jgi:hypothetical protein
MSNDPIYGLVSIFPSKDTGNGQETFVSLVLVPHKIGIRQIWETKRKPISFFLEFCDMLML